jgi:1-acyl-sn-glycerol-3-phosphate acyltransferase
VPTGLLNPGLLDGATHGIPHDRLATWDHRLSPDKVAYPAMIPQLDLHGPTPTSGLVRCEVRADGYLGTPDLPAFAIQLITDEGVWASLRLVEACFPKGPLGSADPVQRRAFLRDREYVPGLSLAERHDGRTVLSESMVAASDWLPGTIRAVYGTRDLGEIAVREHVAAAHQLHPGSVREQLPLTRFELDVSRQGDQVTVSGDPTGRLDLSVVRDFWTRWFDSGRWPVEDLLYGLIDRFVGRVVLEDPQAWDAVRGRSVLYLANHQVGIESLLLSTLLSGLSGVPTVTPAKVEHRTSWLGRLIQHCFSYPGIRDPELMVFVDRQDPVSMGKVLAGLAAEMTETGRSVMVHVEGTRALSARHVVTKMSGSVLDLALQAGAPVVPVRCVGGLPVEPLEERIELPVGLGRQDFWLGRPIAVDELAGLALGERKGLVLERMRSLGPPIEEEVPSAPDVELMEQVRQWQERTGVCFEDAALRVVLGGLADPGEQVRRVLAAGSAEDLADDRSPEGRWLHELGERLLGAGRDEKTGEDQGRNED